MMIIMIYSFILDTISFLLEVVESTSFTQMRLFRHDNSECFQNKQFTSTRKKRRKNGIHFIHLTSKLLKRNAAKGRNRNKIYSICIYTLWSRKDIIIYYYIVMCLLRGYNVGCQIARAVQLDGNTTSHTLSRKQIHVLLYCKNFNSQYKQKSLLLFYFYNLQRDNPFNEPSIRYFFGKSDIFKL